MAGTITALEVQKRNRERVNVYVDDEFAFGLPMVEAARLRKGQHLSDAEIASLKALDTVEQAYDRALHFLGQRPRSIAEIRRNLTEKDTPAVVVDEVIARLEARGYVDDLAFARYWIANRQQFRPRGILALRYELREKGVPDAIIDEALHELDSAQAAYAAARDKARRLRGLDKRTFRNKLNAHLARRGFDYDTVSQAVDRVIEEMEADNTDAFTNLPNDVEEC